MNIIAWVLGSQVTSRTIKWGKSSSCECFLDIDRGGCLVVNFMSSGQLYVNYGHSDSELVVLRHVQNVLK